MKKFYILFLIIFFPAITLAEVSQFVFITPEQTVVVNTISKAITIQSQNSAGVSEVVTETTDLIFDSTSATGKFVASSGKPASKTMSKNTARRTFYYIDSTTGTYTLTVKTTGRTSKKVFSVSQKIIVGSGEVSTEVKNVPLPSFASSTVPIKVESNIKKKVIPIQKSEEIASSTKEEKKETSALAAVIYTAPPKISTLESFLWLPKKIWSAVKSVFR